MSSLTIRHKIWVSFAILLALLMTVGAITVTNLQSNEKKLVELVNEVQPTVVLSLNLIDQLDRASASLGFYLLSKEDIHKQDYIAYLKKIIGSMAQLKTMPLIQRDRQATEIAKQVETKIKKLVSYKDHMMRLANDDGLNIPARRVGSQEVNPRVQSMLQLLQEMLLAEQDEEASEARKKLLIDINELRYVLVSAVNELRLYLAFRAEVQIANFQMFRETLEDKAKNLATYDEDFLTFEQYEALQSFLEVFEEYFQKADELMEIHKAEDWRQDAYIIRKEIAPLLLDVQGMLNKSVDELQTKSMNDSLELTKQALRTQLIVGGLSGAGLLAAMLIGFLLSRAINNPIGRLKESAVQLAQGNLEQAIDTSRKDELGSLAQSFADMRDAIRKKIQDLHVLNETGESLAGMHSQLDALQMSLKVMKEQTNVEWGSVYLYNEPADMLEIMAYYPEREEAQQQAKYFKLGEGITGKTALEKRVHYIPDSSQEPDFSTAGTLDTTPRAIICVPLIDNGEVFGVMNFSGEVGKVKFEKSDAEFAQNVARMTVVTSKNINMLNVIEEQNHTLEKKVFERTSELRKKTNDINNMLQTMHQGIFTIYAGDKIHPEYSTYLERIFETKQIADANALEFLFVNSDLGPNQLDQVKASIGALVGEDSMMFDFNSHLLVKEYRLRIPEGETKILELDWDPIIDENDVIEKIMVTVRDVTNLRGLEAEAEQQKWELEVIGQILAVSQNKFKGFVDNAFQFLNENEKYIKSTETVNTDVVATLFRNMHTIKGNARTYGFNYVTDALHQAEDTYSKLCKNEMTDWNQELLMDELNEAKALIKTYDNIYQEKLAHNDIDGEFIDHELLADIKEILTKVNVENSQNLLDTLQRVQQLFGMIGTESVHAVLDGIVNSIPDLAAQLGKDAPCVLINANHVRLNAEITSTVQNIFTHGFRNSVDHGLETVSERRAAGKSDQGTITLEVESQNNTWVFRLFDDGRGLALAKLKQKAIEAGIFEVNATITDEDVAEVIFNSGLSSTDAVSDISGRGVGMDAVRGFVKEVGGDIDIVFTGEADSNHEYRPFEARITLPSDVAVKVA